MLKFREYVHHGTRDYAWRLMTLDGLCCAYRHALVGTLYLPSEVEVLAVQRPQNIARIGIKAGCQTAHEQGRPMAEPV